MLESQSTMIEKTIIQAQELEKTSLADIETIFEPLTQFSNYVFWIRDSSMMKQLFTSDQYHSIWGHDLYILYDIPLLWLETLERENYEDYMKQMQYRHDRNYKHRKDNLCYYKIQRPDGQNRSIRCQVIKCSDFLGREYLVGISQNIPDSNWLTEYASKEFTFTQEMQDAYNLFFKLLKNNFGITELLTHCQENQWQIARDKIYYAEGIKFTLRELQCIYYLCLGKTTKETSRQLGGLSPRTVEDYLSNIRSKTECSGKLSIISRFYPYFQEIL